MRAVTQDETCVSSFALDRWFGGELSANESRALSEHLESCARCSLRADAQRRQRAAFYTRAPSWDAFATQCDRARPAAKTTGRARWVWGVTALAAAGVIALWSGLTLDGHPELQPLAASGVRSKGGPSIGVYVKRGEQIRRGASGEVVVPGELLRFTYSSERPAYLALLNVDASGAAVYFPVRSDAAKIAAGRDVALDFSIQLDAMLGTERVYGLFCEEPIEVEPVRAELARSARLPALPGCRTDLFVLNKRAE